MGDEAFRDLGKAEELECSEQINEDWNLSGQRRIFNYLRKPDADLSGSLLIRLHIPFDVLKELVPVIELRYDGLAMGVSPINRYIRDLIIRDCGISIDKRDRQVVDPLCMEDVVEGLIRSNPIMWDEHQKMWLRWRSQGMSYPEICELTAKNFPEECKPFPNNLSVWFNKIRKEVFGISLGKLHYGLRTVEGAGCSKTDSTPTGDGQGVKRERGRGRGRKKKAPESSEADGGCGQTPPGYN